MFLAMASPVFEAMFFGGLAESNAGNTQEIKILDVQPDAFYVMLQYIYNDHIKLNSFELACDICYAAKKYMLPALVQECTNYLVSCIHSVASATYFNNFFLKSWQHWL